MSVRQMHTPNSENSTQSQTSAQPEQYKKESS